MHDSFAAVPKGPLPLADQAIAEGDPERALEHYAAAVARGDADALTRAGYGVLLWRLYRFAEAEPLFAALRDDPGTPVPVLQRIAKCYFEVGRFDASARTMSVAVRRDLAPSAALLNTWAWTLERDGQTDAAREVVERALQRDPAYGPAARLLAHLDRRAGDWDAAAARLIEQLHKHPSEFDWALRYELATVHDRLGRYDDAWRELRLAKEQLAPEVAAPLRLSYAIRGRQWGVASETTDADLRRWRSQTIDASPPRRVTLLCGFPRSGTTLLEQMIASHPDAIDTDEAGVLPRQFLEPLVWNAPDPAAALIELRSFDAGQLAAGREAYFTMTEAYLGEPVGGRLLIEKDPLLTADLPMALRLLPEASVLVALRDPRDVVLSYLFTMVPLNWTSAPAAEVVEACKFYAAVMRHWLLLRERLPWPTHVVRYEELVEDPAEEIGKTARFLGLAWDDAMVDRQSRSERRAVRTPTYDDVTQPIYRRALGRWRHYERYLAPGLSILAPFVKELGYEV